MYPNVYLSEQNGSRELLDLRRSKIRERRARKASRLIGVVLPTYQEHDDKIIDLPVPGSPKTA